MFKNGHEESAKTNPKLKFSDQNWGETLVHYTKSVKRLSKAKLKEIVHATHAYHAAQKGHAATQRSVKCKSVMEDKTNIQGQILLSSDIKQSDDEGKQEVSEGDEEMMGIYLSLIHS